jgi:hypothetical protein
MLYNSNTHPSRIKVKHATEFYVLCFVDRAWFSLHGSYKMNRVTILRHFLPSVQIAQNYSFYLKNCSKHFSVPQMQVTRKPRLRWA